MLRFFSGVTLMDRIKKKHNQGTAEVRHFGDNVRETRLRWFGHVQRGDSEYIGRSMLKVDLLSRRQKGRPKRGFMDVGRENM